MSNRNNLKNKNTPKPLINEPEESEKLDNDLIEYEFGINTLRDQKIVDELTKLVYGNRKVDKTCYTENKDDTSIVVTIDKDFNTYIKEILYKKPNKSKYLEYLGKYNKLTKKEKSFDCPICFEDVGENKAYRILECGHKFHKTCIDKWLYNVEKSSCPMCRKELAPDILDKSDKSDKTAEIENI